MKKEEKEANNEDFFIENIISKVRAYRIRYGVSQRELSKKSGVTQNIISRMENGTYTPKLQTLIKLMNVLNLQLEVEVKPKNIDLLISKEPI